MTCAHCGVGLSTEKGRILGAGYEFTCMAVTHTRKEVRYDPAEDMTIPAHTLCKACAHKLKRTVSDFVVVSDTLKMR